MLQYDHKVQIHLALRPDDAGLPQRVDDGVVHDGVRLAALHAHRLVCSQCTPPIQQVLGFTLCLILTRRLSSNHL